MNTKLTQLIQIVFHRKKQFLGQIYCVFFSGTLVDQDSQQLRIGEVFRIFT